MTMPAKPAIDILIDYLLDNGYDGLYTWDHGGVECGCLTSQGLIPCDGMQQSCVAAYLVTCVCADKVHQHCTKPERGLTCASISYE
jgi:hypothetical protein